MLRDDLIKVSVLCDRGFASYNPAYYAEIKAALSPHANDERVKRMIAMAEAGPILSSPRFAYPHIQSTAKYMLEKTA